MKLHQFAPLIYNQSIHGSHPIPTCIYINSLEMMTSHMVELVIGGKHRQNLYSSFEVWMKFGHSEEMALCGMKSADMTLYISGL